MEFIASQIGVHVESLFWALWTLVVILVTGTTFYLLGRKNGRYSAHKWFFSHAKILTFSVKDAAAIGGGVVRDERGLFYVAPAAEHLRRAASLEDAVTWAKNLSPGCEISLYLLPPQTISNVAVIVYMMKPCEADSLAPDGPFDADTQAETG